MTTPVIVNKFGSEDASFSLERLNENFAALVAVINALSADTVLQLGVTPGNLNGYLPITGGSLLGQLAAPSVLVGPVAGPQYPVVTTNDMATADVAGIVKKAAASADATASAVDIAAANAGTAPAGGTGTAAGGWDTAPNRDAAIAVINALATLANELKSDLGTLKSDLNNAITNLNTLKASLRAAGTLST